MLAIVATGGTIAEAKNAQGKLIPALNGQDLIKTVPELRHLARFSVINFSSIDSSQMSPARWQRLSRLLIKLAHDPKYQGIIVTHGTDTMAEGAFFADVTTPNIKPIVFTGAMRGVAESNSDGTFNLVNAVREALSRQVQHWGVTLNMNQYIYPALYTRKSNSVNTQAFSPGEGGYLGFVQGNDVEAFHPPKKTPTLALPKKKLPKVVLVTTYAGADGSLIKAAVKQGIKGLVIESFGAGNVNKASYQALLYALKKGVVVVDTTRVATGGVWPAYGDKGGAATLQKHGVILGGELSGPKARLLLMLALADDGKNVKAISQVFHQFS